METSLMVHDYPEPHEVPEKTIRGKITLDFNFETDFPEKLDSEEIKEIIKENLVDYIDLFDYEEIEIEI